MQPQRFVALRLTSKVDEDDEWRLLDFLPINPTDLSTAVKLSMGGSVAGQTRDRRVRGRTWIKERAARVELQDLLVEESIADEVIRIHNAEWDLSLSLFRNDCTAYAESLLIKLKSSQEARVSD